MGIDSEGIIDTTFQGFIKHEIKGFQIRQIVTRNCSLYDPIKKNPDSFNRNLRAALMQKSPTTLPAVAVTINSNLILAPFPTNGSPIDRHPNGLEYKARPSVT